MQLLVIEKFSFSYPVDIANRNPFNNAQQNNNILGLNFNEGLMNGSFVVISSKISQSASSVPVIGQSSKGPIARVYKYEWNSNGGCFSL